MPASGGDPAVRDLERLFDGGPVGGLTDGDLLERFVARREEAVFAAILRRHGPMVWGVCRRVLRDHHAAEDAFQATFLVLARRAAVIRPAAQVGPWLHGVARQTALKARGVAARRRLRESQIPPRPGSESHPEAPDHAEQLAALDHEIHRLPDRYRLPIVLCELEGKTHREAADLLGWPVGTVSGRLARARTLLAERMSRQVRGGAMVALLGERIVVPASLVGATARAQRFLELGQAGMVSAGSLSLMRGVIRTMIFAKLKLGLAVTVGLGLAVGGAGLAYQASAAGPPQPQEPAQNPAPKAKADRPVPKVDPTASYPFEINAEKIYEFGSLQIDTGMKVEVKGKKIEVPAEFAPDNAQKLTINGKDVSILPINTERGITGAMLIGKLEYEYNPAPGHSFKGSASAAMLRYNPESTPRVLQFPDEKQPASFSTPGTVTDKGLAELARHLLSFTVNRCYQRNYTKDGRRKQEVLIPAPDAFAAVLYTKEFGELLISFDAKTAVVHDFTARATLYQK